MSSADFFYQLNLRLELPAIRRKEITRELECHRRDIIDGLLAAGAEEPDAEREATSRLGAPDEIASGLNAAHYSGSLKAAILAAVPFFGWAICLMMPAHLLQAILGSLLGAVLVIGSARELICRRRPIWLATWMPAGYVGLWHAASEFAPRGPAAFLLLLLSVVYVAAITWKSASLRKPTIALLGILVGGTVSLALLGPGHFAVELAEPVQILLNLSVAIPLVAMIYIAALRLFADSEHGSAWRASLFLFAYAVNLDAYTPLLPQWLLALSFATAGLMVIPLVMGSTWSQKAGWLSLGLLAKFGLFDVIAWQYNPQLVNGSLDMSNWQPYAMALLIMWVGFTVVCLAPMFGARPRRLNRRQAAAD